MEYQFPLTAIHRNGTTRVFNDAKSFLEFTRDRSNGNIGGFWAETHMHWNGNRKMLRLYSESSLDWWTGVQNDWIVRDDYGRPVDKSKIVLPDGEVFPVQGYWNKRFARQKEAVAHAMEKGLPIPGTRKRRWHRKSSTHHGRNGAHNQRKGIKLYEDPKIKNGDFDDL